MIPKTKKWSARDTLDMGPLGKYVTKFDYRFLGKKGRLHHIAFKCDLIYTPSKHPSAKLPFIVQDANLKSIDGGGEILFDADKGRLAKLKASMRVEGALCIEIDGAKTQVFLTQSQTSLVRMTDRNPIAEKTGAK